MTEEKDIQIFTGYEDLITFEEVEEYPEIFLCLDYLLLKESKDRLSMEQIADMLSHKNPKMPTTRQGLYLRVEKWRRDGTLRRAEELFIAPKLEEMRAAIGEVISEMPTMLRRLILEATNPERSGKTALEIFQYLSEIARDEISKQKQPGAEEKSYAKRAPIFDPTEIEE